MGIEELITGFKQLSAEQQHEVINELYRHLVHGEAGETTVKAESDKLLGEKCPHCGSKSYFANGRLKECRGSVARSAVNTSMNPPVQHWKDCTRRTGSVNIYGACSWAIPYGGVQARQALAFLHRLTGATRYWSHCQPYQMKTSGLSARVMTCFSFTVKRGTGIWRENPGTEEEKQRQPVFPGIMLR